MGSSFIFLNLPWAASYWRRVKVSHDIIRSALICEEWKVGNVSVHVWNSRSAFLG